MQPSRFKTWTSALVAAGFALATPLAAQDDSLTDNRPPLSDDVQIAYVYGDDEAPPCPEGDICVFARLPENERFRIPPALRFSDSPQNNAWARRVESLELVGAFGAFSCSPAGAGGFTGCTQQLINDAYRDRKEGEDVRFSQLIEQARRDRLQSIDADAAAEQERVEQIEREYLERLERERAGALPGEVENAAGPPSLNDDEETPSDTAEPDGNPDDTPLR
ncbi:hypothetical protein [Erythrobacter sp. JK5]|uniref:hypothetical protein n=1 Tax=Erythrobacter sp. JK5 TaxID=2829500 RepID=UPI001BAD8B5A|nr:hypothetical protein [Erythrobacter sp. JK5]QUL37314.1 hypothetical protein KDC96_13230 [Erythrobacter sp. JK5]